jgi:hypothetical protein
MRTSYCTSLVDALVHCDGFRCDCAAAHVEAEDCTIPASWISRNNESASHSIVSTSTF